MNVERVQLGVRMEKRMVKVLKGLAEFEGVSLGQLLEKIVLPRHVVDVHFQDAHVRDGGAEVRADERRQVSEDELLQEIAV